MTVAAWQRDKAWADGYLSQIEAVVRSIAGKIVEFRPGTDQEDQKEATDYVVHVASGTIACRIRRNCRYRDLTIRSSRPSGAQTELAKIREGWGRWYLYMWVRDGKVEEWIFVDLDKLRQGGLLDGKERRRNPDGVTFLPIHVSKLKGCLVERGGPVSKVFAEVKA